jgi:hypothetical protein
MPVYDQAGNVALKFLFSQSLQPFLINLKEYVSLNLDEVISLKSAFSIRIFQILKAYRSKFAKHQQNSQIKYELEDLKTLLGIGNKYHDYRNLKKKVLDVIHRELNEKTTITFKYIPLKEGRKVKFIQFEFSGKRKKAPSPTLSKPKITKKLTIDILSFAQLKAFQLLTQYGVTIPLALDMVAKVQSSEMIGFQDWYFEEVIRIFETKTNQTTAAAKTGTLVNWFLKKRIFEQGDHFAAIMEKLQQRKKQLQKNSSIAWENRILAKGISAKDFRSMVLK